ncbi:50S ribosomal protein L25 [Lentisphaera profundi]|uniref:Large ribosomal subunit protein bL25 n=1 Tax=Lentisphaera profundi TaxID=1658616 RepID=A0ABY7VVF1_9BACT|nr:50S ribosomal protein L25 [Lentisphaera profundi]WDE97876.1 50S ribosomal protein L25 [Lentisphaera profundi]
MSIILKAAKREIVGKKSKQLRREAIVPGNLQGRKIENINIQLAERDLQVAIKAAGTTNIIDLDIDGTVHEVLLREVIRTTSQQHYIHVEFYAPDMNTPVKTSVPVKATGESPLVTSGGILVTPQSNLELSALPKALPAFIEIDISVLQKFSDVITVASLPAIEGVDFLSPAGTALAYIAETRATRSASATDADAETAATAE